MYLSVKNILIVDDDYSDYLFIKDSLEDAVPGLKLSHCNSYDNALAFVKTNEDIDFLVLDYDLGAKKGDELYQNIKKIRDIPTVFITGNLDTKVCDSLMELGVLNILQKDSFKIEDITCYISQTTADLS